MHTGNRARKHHYTSDSHTQIHIIFALDGSVSHLPGLLGRREGSVVLLFHNGGLLAAHVLLLELGQEALPVLVGQGRVLGQLAFDHQSLDVVDGVNVLDAILHHFPHLYGGMDTGLCQE
jgi:hypothetical protein